MMFARTLAGLALLAFAAIPASAQRGMSAAGRLGGTTLAAPASAGPAQQPSGARPSYLPAPVGVHPQSGGAVLAHPPLPITPILGLGATSRFALRNAPPSIWAGATFRPRTAVVPNTFLGRDFGRGWGYRRPFPHFPSFFFGGGPSACSPLLPGFFGSPWFDRQFTCFGTPFYGVNFYPEGFLAPQLAYEPWLEGVPQANEQLTYGVGYDALIAGNLDMIAGVAARESAESNPSQQITILVLKEGISIGAVDYWVNG